MMDEKKKFIKYLNLFIIVFLVLLSILVSIYGFTTLTNSRYIKKEIDEVRGYYTSLHFDGTGEGNCIVLENNVGYTTFKLMNFVGEDVTKRDIEYNIRSVSDKYYDETGKEKTPNGDDNLYVLDVWGRPQHIQKDTYKYQFEVVNNDGEKGSENNHMFSYQEVNEKGVGKTHTISLKIKRDSNDTPKQVEYISIIVDLVKPYHDVFIINMIVVNRLIAFNNVEYSHLNVDFERLNIQTADKFETTIKNESNETTGSISPKAFLVTLEWENLIIEKRDLTTLHNVVDLDDIMKALKDNSTKSYDNSSNIDITKSYIVNLEINNSSGTLTLYIPQSSNINIDFLPVISSTNTNYEVKAFVQCFDSSGNPQNYDKSIGGYENIGDNASIIVLSNDPNDTVVH